MSNPHSLKRVAILFAGGPAPAANAVIAAAATTFLNGGIEVVGIKHGYSNLIDYDSSKPLVEGKQYFLFNHDMLNMMRSSPGIVIGTARSNPGKSVSSPAHLADSEKTAPMQRVYDALQSLNVDALISIGGDDTLKTANKIKMFQDTLGPGKKKMPVIHLPKTIDNDYSGIDFTFGYFTAAEFLGIEIRNLNRDAAAGQAYYLCEAMGRAAGWLAYGAAIAGEAAMVMSVEDIQGDLRGEEEVPDPATGGSKKRPIMLVDKVVENIVDEMLAREAMGLNCGVVVVAEGLAEYLPSKHLEGIARDDHGHISIADVNLNRMLSKLIATAYKKRTGKSRKVTGLQLGYESRCTQPNAFDIILGSQIGIGGYRALVEEGLNGVMISVGGQMDIKFVKFEELVDPATLVTKVRFIQPGSDFHRMARYLETQVK